jgi:eukaryotic-like serine/threonine-protein kinase
MPLSTTEDVPVADADARIVRRYRLGRQLASGGMGTVWQGWDERLQRPVAIKRLHVQPGLTETERDVAVKRVMREARLTARLHHPSAVQVFDVVDEGDSPCLIMQYVPSRSLHEIVRENGPLPPEEVARIGTQVAAALAAAHRAGIVHRDVKPGNVLIAEDGTAKITDFGISHAFDDITLTSTGMVTGTPAFLAPEVARGAASDVASDVYSLGATLYMAVEGKPPFGTDQNPMAVLYRVASGESDPPTHSGSLTPMLNAMMSTDAARRPSMVDVANTLPSLHAVTHDPPMSSTTQVITRQRPPTLAATPAAAGDTLALAAPPPSNRSAPPPEDRERHRSWLPIVAAVIVVAVGTVLAIVLLNGTGDTKNGVSGPTSSAPPSLSPSKSKPTTPSPTASPTSPTQNGAPTNQELANAVVDYFNLVPGNLDAGWARLTPHFQSTKAQNRQTYDNFWNSLERVDVSNANGEPPTGATATLRYHYKDGRVVTERPRFRFVRQDGVLKIDGET